MVAIQRPRAIPHYIPPPPTQDHLVGGYVKETLDLLNRLGIKGSSDIEVLLITEGTIQVADGERLIRISGLDGLGKQVMELLRRDQKRSVDLDNQTRRISQVGLLETSLGVFSTAIGIGAAIATGGTVGIIIGAAAVLSGAHQIATRADAYYSLAGKLTNDTERQGEIGQALHTYMGYLCFATTLVNLGMGGTELAKKGFEEATKVSMQGVSDVSAFGQGLAQMTQNHLETKRIELQIEGQKVTLELSDIGFTREEHNMGIRESNKAEELAFQAAMKEHEVKSRTAQQIIKGGRR